MKSRRGISASPAARPSTLSWASAPPPVDPRHRQLDAARAGRQDRVGDQPRVLVEGVVVEGDATPLHVEHIAAVAAAAGDQRAVAVAVRMVEIDDRPPAARRRRAAVGDDVAERRTVDEARAGGRHARPHGGAEELRGVAVVERQDAMPLGLLPPEVGERRQLPRVGRRQVLVLREILGEPVELPAVLVERRAGRVMGHRLPAVRNDAAVAEHLEVLRAAFDRGGRVAERRREADAVQRHLRDAVHLVRRRHADRIEDGRGDVDRVAELAAELAGALQPCRPADDQRVAYAAAVGVLLVPLQRRVAGLRPAPGDVAVAVRPADVVEALAPPRRGSRACR